MIVFEWFYEKNDFFENLLKAKQLKAKQGYEVQYMITITSDGMIQGAGISMHHTKSITIPQYIIAY